MLERIITALVLVAVVLSCMFATQSHYPMFVLMIFAAGLRAMSGSNSCQEQQNMSSSPWLGVMVW